MLSFSYLRMLVAAACFLMYINTLMAQAPLPRNMKSIGKLRGYTDGTGYQIWENKTVDHLYLSYPANQTVRYFDRYGIKSGFVMGDEYYSPNGLCFVRNNYPATIRPARLNEPLSRKDYRDWSTLVAVEKPNPSNPKELLLKDTTWFDNHFAIAITNDGLLICSKPDLKSKNRWEKNELKSLNDFYTYDFITGKEIKLYEGQVWEQKYGQTYMPEWGLTPNGKLFYYTDHFAGIHFWDVATGAHMFIDPATDKFTPPPGASWQYSDGKKRKEGFDFSVSDFETIITGTVTVNGQSQGVQQIFYDNLSGKEITRQQSNSESNGRLAFVANTLYSQSPDTKGKINFWKRDSANIILERSVQLDTLYMRDGPREVLRVEVITPDKAAVWNNYDRIYIMELEFGKSKIVYSDIKGYGVATQQVAAQKKECEQKLAAVKFQNGTTILYNNIPYIVKSYDCYEDKYHIATVGEGNNHPPYSLATITRYNLKPVKALMATGNYITGLQISKAALAKEQLEFCSYCKGMGGEWRGEAVTGPSILIDLNSNKGVYKPLGTMVYNYEVCLNCSGRCWLKK